MTTYTTSASAFVGVHRKVWEQNLSKGFFCLYLRYLHSGDRPAYLFTSLWNLEINGRVRLLAAGCRLIALGVDSNPRAFVSDSLFRNVISQMA